MTDTRGSIVAAQQSIKAAKHRHQRIVARALGIDVQDIEALAPCTPLQQGMIARYLDSEYGLYFNTFKFDLSWDIDTDRLRSAYSAVFEREQILRTAFMNTDAGYVQAVLQGITLPWTEHGIERASGPKYLQKLRRGWLGANQTDLRRPFELHLVGQPGSQVLVVHIFHGLYDGNSIERLFEKLQRTFDGTASKPIEAPTFHNALAHGPLRVAEGAKKFWEAHLSNLTPMPLSSVTPQPTYGTISVTRELDPMPAYDTIRRSLNVTAQAIAQACWVYTLQQYTGSSLAMGMVVSGRSLDLENADHVIGPMFNTIPYHQHTRNGDTWASTIASAHEFNTTSLPYQHTPLRDIMRWRRGNTKQPLFDTLFVFQATQTTDDSWKNNDAWTLQDDDAVADYPLAFEIEQKSGARFTLTLVSQGNVSSVQTSNELLDRFQEGLMSALTDPSAALHQPITSTGSILDDQPDEKHRVNGLNDAETFHWPESAMIIKDEIASLTGIDNAEINESTSIFELGLDSIDAIKLSSRLKGRGVDIPVSGIMRGLTIKTMLANIISDDIDNTWSQVYSDFALQKRELRKYIDLNGVDLSEVDDVLPLTPLQEAMVADMIASDYTRYYNFDVAELAVGTDVERLQNAWHTVIESTPILRTAFVEVDDPQINGSYAQVVVKKRPFKLWTQREKIDNDDKPDFLSVFEGLRRAATHSKALDPPVKITLIETATTTYQVLSIAHALYDGWSLALLHDAVHLAYYGKHVSNPGYEAALIDILSSSGSVTNDLLQDYLTGLKPSLFLQRPTGGVGIVYHEERESSIPLTVIVEFVKNSRVSLQTLGQTIFALTLASYVGSLDVTFGSVLSGRDDDERSRLLFPTMNTVAIRTVLHGTRLELLQYVQDNYNNIKQWQNFPLRKAMALTGAQGKLFDSLFIYQKTVDRDPSTDKKLYNSIEGQSNVEYPVCVEMEVVNGGLTWRCAVKDEVMSFDGAQTLLSRLDEVLQSIIARPDSPSIDSTSQGISVCGLPAFQEERSLVAEEKDLTQQTQPSIDAPLSETTTKIRQALALVSQTPEHDIERGMSIFHIGLDSISAIKVSSILRKQGLVLSVGDMLKAGTVDQMAEVAALYTMSPDQDSMMDFVVKDTLRSLDKEMILKQAGLEVSMVDRILPATPGQIYMLSMWLNDKGANFYPEFIYEIEGSVGLERLHESWQDLVAANAILRTHFIASAYDSLPYVQVILKDPSVHLTVSTGQDDETTVHAKNITTMQQPWIHPFVSQTPKGWTLRLWIHHALYDGVSLPLLVQQFQDLCNGIPAKARDRGLDNYIAAEYALPAISSRKAFWTKYLESVEPQSRSWTGAQGHKTEVFEPNLVLASNMEAFARQQGVSTQAVFLAAYSKLYAARADLASDKDVVIGIYLANRSLPIDNLATAAVPTLNLLPLRISKPLDTALLDAAVQIQNDLQIISYPANATASLYEISEWTGLKIDTFVNFLSLPDTGKEWSSIRQDGGVKITTKNDWQEAVSRVTELHVGNWNPPGTMVNERVNAVYLHAIDIEATIRNGGLDVGVFAPNEMLGLADAETLVQGLKAELESLV